ncbi:MAG TPA: heparin lyase I family protein [Tepidisphaeraceae bacterium]|nr:heparin lyase I family protein [Tepidisphaeraceae bacterium]
MQSAWAESETATSLSDFEVQDPQVVYDPTTGDFTDNNSANNADNTVGFSQNITDLGIGALTNTEEFQFKLRYYTDGTQTAFPNMPAQFWDGNLDTDDTDRQRAEVANLGGSAMYQTLNTTYQYSFYFNVNNFTGTNGFTHIFQLKGRNSAGQDPGDDPLVTLSLGTGGKGDLELYQDFDSSGAAGTIDTSVKFSYSDNTWEHAVITIATGTDGDGSVSLVYNGVLAGTYKDVDVDIDANGTTLPYYYDKWGFYRAIESDLPQGESWIDDQDINATLISDSVPEPTGGVAMLVALTPLLLRRRETSTQSSHP